MKTVKNEHRGDMEWYTDEIIRCLELIIRRTGQPPGQVFDDWLSISAATLRTLPELIKTAGETGKLGPDPASTAEIFRSVGQRYNQTYSGTPEDLWTLGFAKAFRLLLDATEPGLWLLDDISNSIFGPDLLAAVYTQMAVRNPKFGGTYFTPWMLAKLNAKLVSDNLEGEVHKHIQQALARSDNPLGQMMLLGAFLLPPDKPEEFEEYFFTKVLPAAAPYYEPVTLHEPAVGSGIMMLAMFAQLPPWMAKIPLCVAACQDVSITCSLMTELSFDLFGLNGYGLRLNLAVAEAMAAYRERPLRVMVPLKEALQVTAALPPVLNGDGVTFEKVFREAISAGTC